MASQVDVYNADVSGDEWREEQVGDVTIFRPSALPPGLVVAFSGRGVAPETAASATAHLARRFADALGLPGIPIVRATQVHGKAAARVSQPPAAGSVRDAGSCDILFTDLSGVGLAVQTADCVPIVLAGGCAAGVAHAGWRGSARNAAGEAVRQLSSLGVHPRDLRAWLGPSIGPCCYEVGGDVAAQFAGEFARRSGEGGRFVLDLTSVNRAQLEVAGVSPANISTHPACTKCGGEKFASYRRDGAAAGRMIALAARLE